MRIAEIKPIFTKFIPDELEDGVLYISERYKTCSHKCCCGCGEEVVTPLSPAEWTLRQDGAAVTLWPSIGNWDYACQSHYFIRRNRVVWSTQMTKHQIERVRQSDARDLARLVDDTNAARLATRKGSANTGALRPSGHGPQPPSILQRAISWIKRLLFPEA